MSEKVFISEPVSEVLRLYDGLVDDRAWNLSVPEQLERLALRLLDGHQGRSPGAAVELHNWALPSKTRTSQDVFDAPLSLDDALATVARAHGFSRWSIAAAALRTGDANFERALELLLAGDVPGLTTALDGVPGLVRQRSHYGHRATLLHYLAANGVETYRQRVPMNAPEIASLLLARGADPLAVADMYGGNQTARGLLVTSSHPAEAGLTRSLLRVLDGPAGAA